jgi:hypothetical protein
MASASTSDANPNTHEATLTERERDDARECREQRAVRGLHETFRGVPVPDVFFDAFNDEATRGEAFERYLGAAARDGEGVFVLLSDKGKGDGIVKAFQDLRDALVYGATQCAHDATLTVAWAPLSSRANEDERVQARLRAAQGASGVKSWGGKALAMGPPMVDAQFPIPRIATRAPQAPDASLWATDGFVVADRGEYETHPMKIGWVSSDGSRVYPPRTVLGHVAEPVPDFQLVPARELEDRDEVVPAHSFFAIVGWVFEPLADEEPDTDEPEAEKPEAGAEAGAKAGTKRTRSSA